MVGGCSAACGLTSTFVVEVFAILAQHTGFNLGLDWGNGLKQFILFLSRKCKLYGGKNVLSECSNLVVPCDTRQGSALSGLIFSHGRFFHISRNILWTSREKQAKLEEIMLEKFC